MSYIPENIIEEVRHRFDIVDVISSYVDLKKTGKNYMGLCPFHSETSPSFTVSPEKQIFHCFGCQIGGNLFTFIMQVEDLSFPEAVRLLAGQAGIEVNVKDSLSPAEKREAQEKEVLLSLNNAAKDYFERNLWNSEGGLKVRNYLYKRGLDEKTVKSFGLGFAPENWEGLKSELQKKGVSLELAVKGGLLGKKPPSRYYDYFRGRLMFPITDRNGNVVGFGGRVMGEGEPKYLNTPETPLFNKSKSLYGLHQSLSYIRREKEVLLVEGYMDVLLLHQHGVMQAVAPLGTALTSRQVSLLRGRVEKMTLAFDSDRGGEMAALRSLELLKNEGCRVNVARLPQGYDPADYIQEYGAEMFRGEVLERAMPLIEYRLFVARKKFDLNKEEGRANYWKEARKILLEIDETVEREGYLQKIAREIDISLEVLRGDLEKHNKRVISRKSPETQGDQKTSLREKAEEEILSCLLQHPHLAEEAWRELEPNVFSSDEGRKVAGTLFDSYSRGKIPEIAGLMSWFTAPEEHRLIIKMASLAREKDEKTARRTLRDCIKKIKALRWSEEREKLIKSLHGSEKHEEISSKLQRIRDLKKWEEKLYRSGEGEDLNG